LSNEAVDILLVEDDRRLANLTAEYFRQNGLTVAVESRGDRAVARFKAEQPRIVLLDLMLPGADGLTVCRELREFFNGPILIFTARDSDIDQVIGLEAGADDYVAKEVWLDGKNIQLTTQEFELLHMLARHAGTILSRDDIFHRLRGIDYDGLDRSIDGRISKLRRKLGDSATTPSRIKTVWGKGYLLVPDAWGELV
jgi:DNA-binding response OmpR family regulator